MQAIRPIMEVVHAGISEKDIADHASKRLAAIQGRDKNNLLPDILAPEMTGSALPHSSQSSIDLVDAAHDIVCIICRDVLEQPGCADDVMPVTALPCAHTFHTACVNAWAQSKGVRLSRACPFKCHMIRRAHMMDEDAETQQQSS